MPDSPLHCLMRIEAPHYVAGIVWERKQDVVGKYVMTDMVFTAVYSAPILYWVVRQGKSFDSMINYCNYKKYNVELIYY